MVNLTGIDWLAATLAPWSMAPHPNFRTTYVSGQGLLALMADLRLDELQRYRDQVRYGADWEAPFVDAALASVQPGIPFLPSALETFALSEQLPYGARAAAALFCAVRMSERDEHNAALDLLDAVLEGLSARVVESETVGSIKIVEAALLQQRAIRQLEHGNRQNAVSDASRVGEVLANVKSLSFERFPTSRGIAWGSQRLQFDLIDALTSRSLAVRSALESLQGNLWVDLVRERPRWLDVRGERRASRGYSRAIREQFESKVRSVRNSRRLFGGDPVVDPLEAGLFNAEITGDYADLASRRSALGMMRIVRADDSSDSGEGTLVADGIRLLRQANDRDHLESALRWIRARGPNAALLNEAKAVLRKESGETGVNRSDLLVLSSATEMLSSRERGEALELALSYRKQSVDPGLAVVDLADWSRAESTWRTVARLVQGSGLDTQAAQVGLELLAPSNSAYAVAPAVSALVTSIDWSGVSDNVRRQWLSWAQNHAEGDWADHARLIVETISGMATAHRLLPRPVGLELARTLLIEEAADIRPDPEELSAAVSACLSEIVRIRKESSEGAYRMGTRSAAGLAAALGARFDIVSIWMPTIQLLADRLVAARDKEQALDYLAHESPRLPSFVLEYANSRWRSIVGELPEWISDQSSTGASPAALRFGAVYSVVPRDDFIEHVTELAAHGNVALRIEAARCLRVADNSVESSTWAASLLLQLSHDSDPMVVANAGFALARRYGQHGALATPCAERMRSLLRADGIVIPLSVAQGLAVLPLDLRQTGLLPRLSEALLRVQEDSPVESIRVAARSVLGH